MINYKYYYYKYKKKFLRNKAEERSSSALPETLKYYLKNKQIGGTIFNNNIYIFNNYIYIIEIIKYICYYFYNQNNEEQIKEQIDDSLQVLGIDDNDFQNLNLKNDIVKKIIHLAQEYKDNYNLKKSLINLKWIIILFHYKCDKNHREVEESKGNNAEQSNKKNLELQLQIMQKYFKSIDLKVLLHLKMIFLSIFIYIDTDNNFQEEIDTFFDNLICFQLGKECILFIPNLDTNYYIMIIFSYFYEFLYNRNININININPLDHIHFINYLEHKNLFTENELFLIKFLFNTFHTYTFFMERGNQFDIQIEHFNAFLIRLKKKSEHIFTKKSLKYHISTDYNIFFFDILKYISYLNFHKIYTNIQLNTHFFNFFEKMKQKINKSDDRILKIESCH